MNEANIGRESLVPDPRRADVAEPDPVEPDPFRPGEAPTLDEPAPRRRMRRAWGRGAAGLAASALAAGAVVAGALAPWPSAGGQAASVDVTPAASETVLACAGPILALGRDPSAATAIGVAAGSALTAGTASGSSPETQPLTHPDAAGDEAPVRIVQAPDDRAAASVAAAASAQLRDEDLSGFAASACRAPALESWIVGGDTAVGASGILLLSNPGDASATVGLTVYGAAGAAVPPGYDALPIPAGTQRAIPLAGIAGGEAAPVVRVTATGAPVRAALQSSLVRTLDPAGLDVQGAVTASLRPVMPGVVVTADGAAADGVPVLVRVMSRQAGSAVLTAVVEGETEPAAEPVRVTLDPDQPLSVDLGELPAGRYTVTVEATAPVVAAAWQTTGFARDVDFAWQTPSPELTAPTLVAVPEGPEPTLRVANPLAADATVTVIDADGAERTVTVPGGSAASLELAQGVYTIDPGGAPVHAAVSFHGDVALAAMPVWPDPAAPQPITVYP